MSDADSPEQRQADAVRALHQAQTQYDLSSENRRIAARAALDAGVTISRIAQICRVARSTIYQWLRE